MFLRRERGSPVLLCQRPDSRFDNHLNLLHAPVARVPTLQENLTKDLHAVGGRLQPVSKCGVHLPAKGSLKMESVNLYCPSL
jgi:hypothetical protein